MDSIIKQFINAEIHNCCQVQQRLLEDVKTIEMIEKVSSICVDVYRRGNKTLIAGNGGSASDAEHMAAELSGRFNFDRPGIPSIALTANTSAITAIGNDYGYDKVFSRQIQGLGVEGDLFLGISTSGNSVNVVAAVEAAREKGMITVGLTGMGGNKLAEIADYCIQVPSSSTPRIQECHILVIHTICSIVEESLFGKALDGSYNSGWRTGNEVESCHSTTA